MQVILLERIESLGQMGDVVNVKPGFARNYLLPQKKALRATDQNRRRFEEQRTQLEAVNIERRGDAENVAGKLDGLAVVLLRQAGEAGQLYGSVNARDVAQAVTEAGFTADRRQVQLAQPIKALGLYDVRFDLHPEVSVTINVNVARTADEAEIQAKTGKAVITQEEEQPQVDAADLLETPPAAAEAAAEEGATPAAAEEGGAEEGGAEKPQTEVPEERPA